MAQSDNDGNWGLTSSCIIYRLGETIIDTGPSTEWQVVKTYLQEKRIQQALITHHHEDHAGNGGRVQHEFDAKIMGPWLWPPMAGKGLFNIFTTTGGVGIN